MSRWAVACILSIALVTRWSAGAAFAASSGLESPDSLNGSNYTVIAPTFLDSSGNESFVRLINTNTTTAQTIAITVVGSPSGAVYGTASYTIAAYGAPQYALTDILTQAHAGSLMAGDTTYSLYLSQVSGLAFQHVNWNSNTGFYEDMDACTYSASGVNYSGFNQVLIDIDTTTIINYPAYVAIHNTYSMPLEYVAVVFDADTSTQIGSVTILVPANATVIEPFSWYEQQMGWHPTASQYHANIWFQTPDQSSFYGVVSSYIFNQLLNANINMTGYCATLR